MLSLAFLWHEGTGLLLCFKPSQGGQEPEDPSSTPCKTAITLPRTFQPVSGNNAWKEGRGQSSIHTGLVGGGAGGGGAGAGGGGSDGGGGGGYWVLVVGLLCFLYLDKQC